MTPEDRLKLIMERAGKKGFEPMRPRIKDPSLAPTGRSFSLRMIEGLKPKSLNVHSEWLRVPEAKPETHLAPKRMKRTNPLTRIAEQLPAKLPVISFAETQDKRARPSRENLRAAPSRR